LDSGQLNVMSPSADRIRRLNLSYTISASDDWLNWWSKSTSRVGTIHECTIAEWEGGLHPEQSGISVRDRRGKNENLVWCLSSWASVVEGFEWTGTAHHGVLAFTHCHRQLPRRRHRGVWNARTIRRILAWDHEGFPFSKVCILNRRDFMKILLKNISVWSRAEVRLRYAYIIKCVSVVRDEKTGDIVEANCIYDRRTRNAHPEMATK